MTGVGDSKDRPPREEPEASEKASSRADRKLFASGTVEFDGKRFDAGTAVVQYWGQSRWLCIRLYPVEMTAEEETAILAGDPDGIVNGLPKRAGPDGFEAMPALLIVLEHRDGGRADAVERVMFNTSNFEGAGSGTATQILKPDDYTLDGLKAPVLEVGEPVTLSFKSEGKTSFDSWKIDLTVKNRLSSVDPP